MSSFAGKGTALALAAVALVIGSGLTAVGTWAGSAAIGADDTWEQGVSLRTSSAAGGGRVVVGGGISGGK